MSELQLKALREARICGRVLALTFHPSHQYFVNSLSQVDLRDKCSTVDGHPFSNSLQHLHFVIQQQDTFGPKGQRPENMLICYIQSFQMLQWKTVMVYFGDQTSGSFKCLPVAYIFYSDSNDHDLTSFSFTCRHASIDQTCPRAPHAGTGMTIK